MDLDADTADTHPRSSPQASSLARVAVAVGSVGLVGAMATDTIAVLGRHTGFSLLGSIEIVQVAIVLLASASIVLATLLRQHAAVHILTERLRPEMTRRLARGSSLMSGLFFAVLTIGALWLIGDLWDGHERSELLHVPFRVLRIVFALALATVTAIFIRDAFVRGGE